MQKLLISLMIIFIFSGLVTAQQVSRKSVELTVTITEIRTDDLKELGMKWFQNIKVGEYPYYNKAEIEDGQTSVFNTTKTMENSFTGLPSILGVGEFKRLNGFWWDVRFLAEKGKANILATPKLIVFNGRKSSLLIGGEVPIIINTPNGPDVEYKKYGTILDLSCVVYPDNSIDLSITAERSTVEYIADVDYPNFQIKNVSLSMNMKSGDTMTIAGLNEKQFTSTSSGIPFLMDIPIVGYFFKSEKMVNNDVTVVIMVTPRIIEDN